MEKIRARAALSGVKSHPGTRVCRRGVTRTKCVLFLPPRRRRGRNTPRRRGRRWKTTGRQIQMNRKDLAASGARAFTIWLKTRDPGAEPRLFCINAIVIRNMLYCVSVREKRGLGGLGRRRAHSRPAEFGSNCGFFVRFVFSPTFAAKWPDGGFARVVVKKKNTHTHVPPTPGAIFSLRACSIRLIAHRRLRAAITPSSRSNMQTVLLFYPRLRRVSLSLRILNTKNTRLRSKRPCLLLLQRVLRVRLAIAWTEIEYENRFEFLIKSTTCIVYTASFSSVLIIYFLFYLLM